MKHHLRSLFLCCFVIVLSLDVYSQQNITELTLANNYIANAKKNSLKDTALTKSQLSEALSIAVKLKSDSLFAKIYEVFGSTNAKRGKIKEALSFFDKQLSYSKKTGSEFFIANSLMNISNAQSSLGRDTEAINTALSALQIFEKIKNSPFQAKVLLNIGTSYMYMGNYEDALRYEIMALSINEKINDKVNMASNLAALGVLSNRMRNFKDALSYNNRAISLFKELKDELLWSNTKFNVATIELKLKEYKQAEQHLLELIPFYEKINRPDALRKIYGQLINVADETDREKEAENYLKKALQYSVKTGNPVNDIEVILNEVKLFVVEKKYDLAEQKLAEATSLADKANLSLSKMNIKRHYILLYQESGQKNKGMRAFTSYDLMKDSLLNKDNLAKINELQTKYETSKKEAQIFLLNKENAIKALQLKNNALEISKNKSLLTTQQQQITINGLELSNKNQALANQKLDAQKKTQDIKALQKQSRIQNLELKNKKLELEQRNLAMGSILVVFLALGGISFSFYKRNQLKQQNQLQTEIYKQQEIATKSVFEGEQNERIRIARDLHDGIGQMLSVVKMNVSTLNPSDKTVEGTLSLVDKTITELRAISHNLIPEALNFGLFAALEDICKKINDAGKTKVDLNVAQEMDEVPLTEQNKLSIYRIVQEVLNNMIKHANASHISIDIKKANENMLIAIKDDGDGFDTSKIDDSKGIGWKNISARVHLMDGDMNIKSEKLIGTQIEISIPA
ncbi:tetratricopeptide repeat-containing sensor histidine kinase [Pedobacter chitinilyticus]|uniref:histidine kinase n=1 Tax=Pedobacter chitinilyticus TaxID=2233776 RepID=A0A3S3PAF9_9SPHI|nr:tetratricopeptide repeat-containing sensor histidine kinase [Pedobacter chitinilyticus]RWU04941.1 tetratricopeptide repeat protein [Pedobacter chitinilyticus]